MAQYERKYDGWYKTQDIARELGVDPKTPRNWINRGRIEGIKHGKDYIVSPAEYKRITVTDRHEFDKNVQPHTILDYTVQGMSLLDIAKLHGITCEEIREQILEKPALQEALSIAQYLQYEEVMSVLYRLVIQDKSIGAAGQYLKHSKAAKDRLNSTVQKQLVKTSDSDLIRLYLDQESRFANLEVEETEHKSTEQVVSS